MTALAVRTEPRASVSQGVDRAVFLEAWSRRRVVRALYNLAGRLARAELSEHWPSGDDVPRSLLELAGRGQLPKETPPCLDLSHWAAWHHCRDAVHETYYRWTKRGALIDTCKEFVTLLHCPGCKDETAIVKTCRSRYCAWCVGDVRAATKERVRELVRKHFRHPPRFITLTKRNRRDLAGGISDLVKAFGRMRRLTRVFRRGFKQTKDGPRWTGGWASWDDLVRGGVYAVEVTEDLGRRDERVWHPHLHMLVDAHAFLPWPWLVEAWMRANGCKCPRSKNRQRPVLCKHSTWREEQGRFQTWSEHAQDLGAERATASTRRNPERELERLHQRNRCTGCDVEPGGQNIEAAAGEGAVNELCKYVGKSLKSSAGMMAFEPALQEFLQETWGRRMLSAFGELHGAEEREEPAPRKCDKCGDELEFVGVLSVAAYDQQQRAPPPGAA